MCTGRKMAAKLPGGKRGPSQARPDWTGLDRFRTGELWVARLYVNKRGRGTGRRDNNKRPNESTWCVFGI